MATRQFTQVTLELTAEQSDAIKSVLKQNNWDYIEIRSRKERTKKRKYDLAAPSFCTVPSGSGDPDGGDPGHGDDIADASCKMRCIHCFMNPCVVSQRHLGGEGQGPSESNKLPSANEAGSYRDSNDRDS